MRDEQTILEVLDAASKRREARRGFLRAAGAATVAAGGLSLLAACNDDEDEQAPPVVGPAPPPAAVNDIDILNFALNLEYLEAQFYSYAVFGTGLAPGLLTGLGTQGAVVSPGTGAGQPRQVSFTGETLIGQYAREIANDEIAHVAFLRNALGAQAVAQPAINISGDATGAFTAAARAANVVGPTGLFDPYASPDAFLIGAYIFEDVGVTAYKGGAPLLSSAVFLEAAAGILAAEAYHAGLVRTILYARGQTNASLITQSTQISDLRDAADGAPALDAIRGIGPDDDQGLASSNSADGIVSNLVPVNVNGLAYSRNTQQVHNIVYLNSGGAGRARGGFFPNGTNNTNPLLTVGTA
jgi:hypothetical protein